MILLNTALHISLKFLFLFFSFALFEMSCYLYRQVLYARLCLDQQAVCMSNFCTSSATRAPRHDNLPLNGFDLTSLSYTSATKRVLTVIYTTVQTASQVHMDCIVLQHTASRLLAALSAEGNSRAHFCPRKFNVYQAQHPNFHSLQTKYIRARTDACLLFSSSEVTKCDESS